MSVRRLTEPARTARLAVLVEGYVRRPHVAGTVRPSRSARRDVTTLVGTPDHVVALTHPWWTADGPAEDRCTLDREQLPSAAAAPAPRAPTGR